MHAVDANVLVRLVTRDEPKQVAAAESFVAKGAWVSLLVLMETVRVLDAVYELGSDRIAAAIDLLLDHEHLTLEDPAVVSAALLHYQKRPALGFADCLILESARKAGHLPLGTFDKALGKLPGGQRL